MGDGTRATRARQLVWRQGTAKRLRAGDLDGGKGGSGGKELNEDECRRPAPPPPPPPSPFCKSVGKLKGPGSLRAIMSLISLL